MAFVQGTETYRLAFSDFDANQKGSIASHHTYISYGLPFQEACVYHITNSFQTSRVYIIASSSLSKNTDAVKSLQSALGRKLVGTRVGMKPHTLWSEIMEITAECRLLDVDTLVTLGGGSLTDASKVVALALANDLSNTEDLRSLPTTMSKGARTDIKSPTVPIICIPTTLSGGEFTNVAGATDDSNNRKHQFVHPLRGAELVILDPQLTTLSPERIWLSTGMRGVDHCTETLCSIDPNSKIDKYSAEGLRMLIEGLLGTKLDSTELQARLSCQLGLVSVMNALDMPATEVPAGASHGIGHMLGPLGVGHGETSCILLPAVCKYNAMHNANNEQQKVALEILWSLPKMREVAQQASLRREKADLGDMLDAFVRALGLPRSLKDVGVGRDKFDQLAENSLHDNCCLRNPVPLTEKHQVMEILEMVAG